MLAENPSELLVATIKQAVATCTASRDADESSADPTAAKPATAISSPGGTGGIDALVSLLCPGGAGAPSEGSTANGEKGGKEFEIASASTAWYWPFSRTQRDYMWKICSKSSGKVYVDKAKNDKKQVVDVKACCDVYCPFAISPAEPSFQNCETDHSAPLGGIGDYCGDISRIRSRTPASVPRPADVNLNCDTVLSSANPDVQQEWASQGGIACKTNLVFGTICFKCK